MSNYDKDFISLLEKSGCIELDLGAETGSDRLLSLLDKRITPNQMIKSVEKLRNWGPSIEPYVSWMGGLPTETDDDIKVTLNLMDKMSETNQKTQHFGFFIYTPFPSPILEFLGSNFNPPQSLEEWGNVDMFQFRPSWHSTKYVEKLHTISAVVNFAFLPGNRIKEHGITYRIGYGIMNKISKYRWKYRCFEVPVELRIAGVFARKLRGYI